MQFSTFLIAVFASVALGAAVPRSASEDGKLYTHYFIIKLSLTTTAVVAREPKVETQGASGSDDDDAIAYAWFAEDE
ncbi:hypothetical protein F4860DRAFT_494923 [Xylaria cubensis]|nr:hypothetical protein F4860DRAFT_494923 [Xylaria cubensis]